MGVDYIDAIAGFRACDSATGPQDAGPGVIVQMGGSSTWYGVSVAQDDALVSLASTAARPAAWDAVASVALGGWSGWSEQERDTVYLSWRRRNQQLARLS